DGAPTDDSDPKQPRHHGEHDSPSHDPHGPPVGQPVLVTALDEQKYLLLKVPDFAKDIAGDPSDPTSPLRSRYGEAMTSYLRLGAASLEREPGDELVPYAFMSGPAGTQSSFDGDPSEFWDDADAVKKYTAFIDDERNRGLGNVEPTGASGHG